MATWQVNTLAGHSAVKVPKPWYSLIAHRSLPFRVTICIQAAAGNAREDGGCYAPLLLLQSVNRRVTAPTTAFGCFARRRASLWSHKRGHVTPHAP